MTVRQSAGSAALLIVLAKAPEPGRVKTRLSPPATSAQAAELAAAALLDTLDTVRAVPRSHGVLAWTGTLRHAARAAELGSALRRVRVVSQRAGSLGARIAAAHADIGARWPGRPSLQIGMDTPQADAALLAGCLRTLRLPGVDAVLGPATDGGWWALGLRDPRAARLIARVPTSRPDTGERTLHALRSAGLRVELAPVLTDVDTWPDAVAAAGRVSAGRFAATVRDIQPLTDAWPPPARQAAG